MFAQKFEATPKLIQHVIKRWSEAESFTIFENHVYRSKKNLMFAQNFEATSIKVDSGIQKQEKSYVCTKL